MTRGDQHIETNIQGDADIHFGKDPRWRIHYGIGSLPQYVCLSGPFLCLTVTMGLRHNLSAILGQVNIPRVQENERLNEGSITDISHINSVAGPTFLLLSHVN